MNCPYCGGECDAHFEHNGLGFERVTAYVCMNCGATEIGPYDDPRELSEEEKRTGFYKP